MQERQPSDTLIHSIVHKDTGRFVINTHGFHNAGLLRKYLPVALTKPRPLFLDRRARHDDLSKALAVQQQAKRAATQAKTAATRQKRKVEQSNVAREEGGSGSIDEQGAQKRGRQENPL
jgi:hypothetical protein